MELAGKVALITGATGLVGSRLTPRLLQAGMRVRALDRVPPHVAVAGVEVVAGDITDAAAVQQAAAGATLIVHCATVIGGNPDEMLRVNGEGTRVLQEAAVQAGCTRVVHLSSGAVYALDNRAVVDESTPLRQEGPTFPLSKVAAEHAVWAASARGLPVTVFRPQYILGGHPTSTWAARFAQALVQGRYALEGDGSGSWPYVHVDNLAEAVVLALHSPRAVGQVYNIVDGQTTARAYADRFRQWLAVGPLPTQPEVVPWRGRFSGEKAVRELGYRPRVTYAEALAEIERYLTASGLIKR
jgi:nucleoside-diphosphate-sugar epimerase